MPKLSYKNTLHSCYMGYVVQATIVTLAPLLFVIFQDKFGLSLSRLTSLILINFCFQLAIDLFAAKIVDGLTYKGTMMLSLVLSLVGLVCLGTLPRLMNAYAGLLISTIIYSIGGGLLEAVISPLTDSLPLGDKHGSMALLHSFFSWGELVIVIFSTVFIRLFGSDLWYVLPYIWAVIPLCDIIAFCIVPMVEPVEEKSRTPLKSLFSDKLFILAFLSMIFAGASEAVIAQWSSLFAEKGLGVSKLMGDLLGPSVFALLMAAGRTAYGIVGSRININKVLLVSSFSSIICYLVASLMPNPIISLLACGLNGLSVALLWPGTLSSTARIFPLGSTMLFGLLAFAGDIGCTIGPAISGFVADCVQGNVAMQNLAISLGINIQSLALRGGILVGTIFPILLFVCQTITFRKVGLRPTTPSDSNSHDLATATQSSDISTDIETTDSNLDITTDLSTDK